MIGPSQYLVLRFCGLNIRIQTNRSDYYDYLKMYFGKLEASDDREGHDLEIDVSWIPDGLKTSIARFQNENETKQIGINTYLAGNKLLSIKKIDRRWKAALEYTQEERKIKLNACFRWKGLKDVFRHRFFSRPKEDFFFTITYPLFYYPVFWYLESLKKTHILHASAIQHQGKGIVFCGLEGIGKTSLALSFLREENTQFLSDNLIFYNEAAVQPCYELVRLYKNSDAMDLDDHFEKVGVFRTLKDYYRPRKFSEQKPVPVDYFIFPVFAEKFAVEEMPYQEAAFEALALSYLPSELGNYIMYRYLSNLLKPEVNPWTSQQKTLESLLQSAKCLKVSMPVRDGLQKNAARLKEVLEGQCLKV